MSKFKKSLPVVLSILIALIIILITGLSSPKKDNIEEGLGSYFFNIIEKEMRQDQSSSFKVEINITKIE